MFISFVFFPTNLVFLSNSLLEPFSNFVLSVFYFINVVILCFDDGSDVFVASSHLLKIDDHVPLFANCHYFEICLNLDDFEAFL